MVDEIIVCDNGWYESTRSEVKALGCKIVSIDSRTENATAVLSLFGATLETKADVLIALLPSTRVDPADMENLAAEIAKKMGTLSLARTSRLGC